MTHNLTKPLRELKNNLSYLEMDKEISILQTGTNNEVAMLAVAIKNILNKLRLQNNQLITTRRQDVQAHMEAQLNPHFLYNTLSVIGTCGMENGNLIVPKMCAELSNLLRYSISHL